MHKIVEIYRECGNFYEAVQKSGLPILVAHKILLTSGLLKIQDKIKYGGRSTRLGGEAEEYFQKLVPKAIDANKYWQKNNPVFDFCLDGLYIDVKYSSIRMRSGKKSWGFDCKNGADLIVGFLESEPGAGLKNPYIVIFHNQFVPLKGNLTITEETPRFNDFQVKKEEVKNILEEYAELKKILEEQK